MEQSESRLIPVPLTPSWRTQLPFFYGWVVVGSLFLVQAIGCGVYYSFSVFFVALLEEYGWSRAYTAGVFSLFVVMMSLGGAVAGILLDRFGPSRVVPAGGVLLGLGLLATSRLTELWQFYLFFGVTGSYVVAFAVAAAGSCASCAFLWLAAPRKVRCVPLRGSGR
ncbi:MAG: MFS transporter [Chloroflexota bacterium]